MKSKGQLHFSDLCAILCSKEDEMVGLNKEILDHKSASTKTLSQGWLKVNLWNAAVMFNFETYYRTKYRKGSNDMSLNKLLWISFASDSFAFNFIHASKKNTLH